MINDNYEIRENSFSKERTELCGNKYLIANGFMGYRGTLEEFRKEQLTALNVAGLYDLSTSGGWRESVNAPNPFYTVVRTDKSELSVLGNAPIKHNQTLDIRYGIHKR